MFNIHIYSKKNPVVIFELNIGITLLVETLEYLD